jgi:hypothetical protein
MTRLQALSALAVAAAVACIARPALAAGLIRFRNSTLSGPVTVEVRVGDTLDSAALYGIQKIAKGEDWEVDTSGVYAWWRRELNPGKNDGQFTPWKRVDPSSVDQRVDI